MMKLQKSPCQVFVSFLLALISTAVSRQSSVAVYERCNETLRPSEIKAHDVTVRLRATESMKDAVIYCWTRFEGTGNQFIEVTVRELRLGQDRSSCESSFLRISDHERLDSVWLPPPTTLCGSYNNSHGGKLRVRRRTRTPFALVEFKNDRARKDGGFEYDVTFINKEEESDQLPFGHFHRKDGQLPNTKCDWLIRVDECVGYCNVISPGFPGIYPPNTRCRYLFTHPNQRVELNFGGKRFSGTFDLRISENCAEDYVEVYDGRTQAHPMIGRYCGQNGAHLVSSGSSILMIFQSGPGQDPPWNYTGFNMLTEERWNYYNDPDEGGNRKPNSSCDLVFHSRNSFSGDLHTPDFFLPSETNCTYEFIGSDKYSERVELTIVTQSDGDQTNCTEMIIAYDGATEMKRFCPDSMNGRRSEFMFNTTSNSASVHYSTTIGQLSDLEPTWISFKFWRLPKSTAATMTASSSDSTSSSKGSRMSAGRYGLLSDPPVAPRDHISLDLSASSAAVTITLHRTNSVVEAALLTALALLYAFRVLLCMSCYQ